MSNLFATAEDLKIYTKEFEKFDVNNDGVLTLEEIKEGLERIDHSKLEYSREDWSDLFDNMDMNTDGKIDFSEFIAAAYSRRKIQS
jgi:Ca2+-binding EF-hand superfamily protein